MRGAAAVVRGEAAAGRAGGRLARAHVQPLGAARAQRVHHQQDQVAVRDLLHAERPLAAGVVAVSKFALEWLCGVKS